MPLEKEEEKTKEVLPEQKPKEKRVHWELEEAKASETPNKATTKELKQQKQKKQEKSGKQLWAKETDSTESPDD